MSLTESLRPDGRGAGIESRRAIESGPSSGSEGGTSDARESEELRASWAELFVDLVFVVTIKHVAEPLEESFDGEDVLRYSLRMFTIWQLWHENTTFQNSCADGYDQHKYPGRALLQKVFALFQLTCIATMAASTTPSEKEGASRSYQDAAFLATALVASMITQLQLWWLSYGWLVAGDPRHWGAAKFPGDAAFRKGIVGALLFYTAVSAGSKAAVIALLAGGMEPGGLWLWCGLSVFSWLGRVASFALKKDDNNAKLQAGTDHGFMAERYGIRLLILLGEVVDAVGASAMPLHDWQDGALAVFFACICTAWAMYMVSFELFPPGFQHSYAVSTMHGVWSTSVATVQSAVVPCIGVGFRLILTASTAEGSSESGEGGSVGSDGYSEEHRQLIVISLALFLTCSIATAALGREPEGSAAIAQHWWLFVRGLSSLAVLATLLVDEEPVWPVPVTCAGVLLADVAVKSVMLHWHLIVPPPAEAPPTAGLSTDVWIDNELRGSADAPRAAGPKGSEKEAAAPRDAPPPHAPQGLGLHERRGEKPL